MMKANLFGIPFSVSYPAAAFLALALICDKGGVVLLCFISSILHEAGHLIAMKIKGAKVKSIAFNLSDVAINADASSLSYGAEIFVTVSGVAVNFALSILFFTLWHILDFQVLYNICVSNFLIGAFNLLPVRFLDGGQLILYLLKKRFTPDFSDKIIDVLTVLFVVPIGALGLIFVFSSSYNYSLFFAALYLICTLISKEFKNVS